MRAVFRIGTNQFLLLSTKGDYQVQENLKAITSVMLKMRIQTVGSGQMIIVIQFKSKALLYLKMDTLYCSNEFNITVKYNFKLSKYAQLYITAFHFHALPYMIVFDQKLSNLKY
jgi:hypothetical protein